MRIFITGGTGFIGSHFINAAIHSGHEIVALRFNGTMPRISVPDTVKWIDGDLATWELPRLSKESSDAKDTALVHFAAFGVSPQPCTWQQAFQFNVLDSLSMFQRAIAAGINKIIICGSCVEYGASAGRYDTIPPEAPLEPIGCYAASKAAQSIAAAALCRETGINLAILRLFTVYGDGQHESNFWPSLRKAALSGDDFPMTQGDQIRDFISVEATASAFIDTLTKSKLVPGEPLVKNVGTGSPQSLRHFAEFWWNEWQAKGKLLPGAVPYRNGEVMRYVPVV